MTNQDLIALCYEFMTTLSTFPKSQIADWMEENGEQEKAEEVRNLNYYFFHVANQTAFGRAICKEKDLKRTIIQMKIDNPAWSLRFPAAVAATGSPKGQIYFTITQEEFNRLRPNPLESLILEIIRTEGPIRFRQIEAHVVLGGMEVSTYEVQQGIAELLNQRKIEFDDYFQYRLMEDVN